MGEITRHTFPEEVLFRRRRDAAGRYVEGYDAHQVSMTVWLEDGVPTGEMTLGAAMPVEPGAAMDAVLGVLLASTTAERNALSAQVAAQIVAIQERDAATEALTAQVESLIAERNHALGAELVR